MCILLFLFCMKEEKKSNFSRLYCEVRCSHWHCTYWVHTVLKWNEVGACNRASNTSYGWKYANEFETLLQHTKQCSQNVWQRILLRHAIYGIYACICRHLANSAFDIYAFTFSIVVKISGKKVWINKIKVKLTCYHWMIEIENGR